MHYSWYKVHQLFQINKINSSALIYLQNVICGFVDLKSKKYELT